MQRESFCQLYLQLRTQDARGWKVKWHVAEPASSDIIEAGCCIGGGASIALCIVYTVAKRLCAQLSLHAQVNSTNYQ